MENRTILNKVRELLGMEVKLEQRKLEDGVTIVEADAFEPGAEVMIVTEDEQMIPLPVGDYKMEDGQILVVSEEGIIAEIKEAEEEEEVVEEEAKSEEKEEAGYDDKEEEMAEAKPIKKTVESIVKETFFAEIENLKKENAELKAKIQELSADKVTEEVTEEVSEPVAEKEEVELASDEPADKPISYNPENVQKQEKYVFGKNRPRNIMDRVYEKLNK
jgi:S-DNA-T family DNA segregation ATPase FtsK/SpoIIIE